MDDESYIFVSCLLLLNGMKDTAYNLRIPM